MLANEVHDSLAQGLTYMRMRMSLLRDAIRDDDELRAQQVLQRRRRHARQLAAPAARADHLLPQPDGSAGPGARAARDQRALLRPHRHRAVVRQPRRRPLPAARARDRGLPHRPGGARQRRAPRARPARAAGRWTATAGRLPGRRRGRRRRLRRRRRASRATTIPATTASRSCASAPAASAGPSRWGGPAGPARGSSSRFPRIRRRTRLHNDANDPIRVVLIDDHAPVPPRPVRAARGARRHQGRRTHRQRRRGGAPAARRAARPRDHGPAHGAGRRPPSAHAAARRGHRHARSSC